MRRLAEYHGQLPDSMVIPGRIEVSSEIPASGGFADVRSGKFMGHLVMVKTMRIAKPDDLSKIRKVSIKSTFSTICDGLNRSATEILQDCRSLELAIPPKHPEARRGSGGHGERTVRYCVRVDGPWEHHGVH